MLPGTHPVAEWELSPTVMHVLNVWNALPVRGWPLSLSEEQNFVEELRVETGNEPRTNILRADVTCLLTLLRDGSSLDEAHAFLPGLDTPALLGAYEYLDTARVRSVEAWQSIASNPSISCLAENALQAAVLLPVAVHRALSVAGDEFSSDVVAGVRSCEVEVESATKNALEIEDLLTDPNLTVNQCRALGAKLFDPVLSGVWSNAYYLPRRVTDLSPNRVRLLVGESS